MNKLYNTQENLARDLAKFFEKVSDITKPQLKIIPYIILGMIEAESVVTTDIVKKLKGNFLKVFPSSTTRRLERFFNNPKFNVYELYDEIIKEVTMDLDVQVDDEAVKKAALSYNNALENLDKRAHDYISGDGIAIDARCLGYLAQVSDGKFTKNVSDMGDFDLVENLAGYDLGYSIDNNYIADMNQIIALQISSGPPYCWSASRYVYHTYISGDSHSSPLSMYQFGLIGFIEPAKLCVTRNWSNSSEPSIEAFSQERGFRPVFLLSPDLKIVSGKGTLDEPYICRLFS